MKMEKTADATELRRGLCDGTGGEDIWIGKPRVETHGAAMDNGRGSGKAIAIDI